MEFGDCHQENDMNPYPLEFLPVIKQIIWGGRRLGDQLGKPIGDESDYAESWEVVDHGADQSVVAHGCLAGKTLSQVATDHAKWLFGASHAESSGQFPLLFKYLDCNRVLSVQVHPDDSYGLSMTPPDLGKTEAWYIVDAEPESLIYAGLKSGVDRSAFAAAIDEGRTEEVLHSFHPTPGDVVFIPAGTVHALGAGLLVAEIQQASNTTFRLFDWNRIGADGQPRQLHLEQGLEVTDYESGPAAAASVDASAAGWQSVVECEKFVLRLLHQGQAMLAGDDQFHILTVPRGSAVLRTDDSSMNLSVGQTVLLPAAMNECSIEPSDGSCVFSAHLPSAHLAPANLLG